MRKVVPLSKQYEIMDDCLGVRMNTIIPEIMGEYGYDAWIILCREYNEDPIYMTMMPALCLSARRLSCLLFVHKDGVFNAYNFGRPDSRAARFYKNGYTDIYTDQMATIAQFIKDNDFKKIGINTSTVSGMGDGLSKQLYDELTAALEDKYVQRLVSAYPLSTRWIETRTPEELSRYRSIYALAMDICSEAFSSAVIVPGITTTTEVEEWIGQQINDLGLSFWFSPHVDVQRAGLSGTANADIIIEQGDLLHYDVGIKYFGLCTDSQRLGYVLRDGESDVPEYLQQAFRKTCRFGDIVAKHHIAGKTGNAILKEALAQAKDENIKAMLYSHPIGFFGHSAGTVVGLWDKQGGIGEKGDFPLHYNTCYALEYNTESEIAEWGGQTVRFSSEESVAFTQDGKLSYMYEGRDKIFVIK